MGLGMSVSNTRTSTHFSFSPAIRDNSVWNQISVIVQYKHRFYITFTISLIVNAFIQSDKWGRFTSNLSYKNYPQCQVLKVFYSICKITKHIHFKPKHIFIIIINIIYIKYYPPKNINCHKILENIFYNNNYFCCDYNRYVDLYYNDIFLLDFLKTAKAPI